MGRPNGATHDDAVKSMWKEIARIARKAQRREKENIDEFVIV